MIARVLIQAAFACLPFAVSAQVTVTDAQRPLATRPELQRIATSASGSQDAARNAGAIARRRLDVGDMRPSDLILIEVQGETTLSDTFAVDDQVALTLPAPAVGALSLRGVLRSEVDSAVTAFIARFMHRPVVRVRPLLRIGVTGEVARAGYYAVPADMRLTDLLMVASGTTRDADLERMSVKRGGKERLSDERLRDAMTRGATLDEARMQDGDVLQVARGRVGFEEKLRFVWVLVSVAGGIYGLTRAF